MLLFSTLTMKCRAASGQACTACCCCRCYVAGVMLTEQYKFHATGSQHACRKSLRRYMHACEDNDDSVLADTSAEPVLLRGWQLGVLVHLSSGQRKAVAAFALRLWQLFHEQRQNEVAQVAPHG